MALLDALARAAPPGRHRFARWARLEPVLDGLDYDRLRAILADQSPPVDHDRKDELLGALVRLAAVDPAAGQTVVVCLLPGLRAILARHRRHHGGEDAEATLVAALWRRIARYPLDRRPTRIAANLLLDARHDLTHSRPAEHATVLDPLGDAELAAGTDPDTDCPPALILADAHRAGVLDPIDSALIAATRLDGADLGATARRLGLGYEAARKRRHRAERRLAAWWAPDDAASTASPSPRTDETPSRPLSRKTMTMTPPPGPTPSYIRQSHLHRHYPVLSATTWRRLVRAGTLPSRRIGTAVVIAREDVERFLAGTDTADTA